MPNGQDQAAAAPLPSASVKPVAATAAGVVGANSQTQPHQQHHLWLVTGPAGCGKTTVAEHLANALDIPYIEGDLGHSLSWCGCTLGRAQAQESLTDAVYSTPPVQHRQDELRYPSYRRRQMGLAYRIAESS